MSLREILRRFVRRESLPVAREGVYEERFGDLEKLSKADITIQLDKVEELKNRIADFEARMEAKRKKAEKDEEERIKGAQTPPTPPVVPPTTPGISEPPRSPMLTHK